MDRELQPGGIASACMGLASSRAPFSPADTKGGKIGYFPTFKMLPHPVPFDMHRRLLKHVRLLPADVGWHPGDVRLRDVGLQPTLQHAPPCSYAPMQLRTHAPTHPPWSGPEAALLSSPRRSPSPYQHPPTPIHTSTPTHHTPHTSTPSRRARTASCLVAQAAGASLLPSTCD